MLASPLPPGMVPTSPYCLSMAERRMKRRRTTRRTTTSDLASSAASSAATAGSDDDDDDDDGDDGDLSSDQSLRGERFSSVALGAIEDEIKLEMIIRHVAVEEGIVADDEEDYDFEDVREKVFDVMEKREKEAGGTAACK